MPLLPNQVNLLFEEVEHSEDAVYLHATKVNSGFFTKRFSERVKTWMSNAELVEQSRKNFKIYHRAEHFPLTFDTEVFRALDWEQVVLKRRSSRGYLDKSITLTQLSNLFQMACGLKRDGQWVNPIVPGPNGRIDASSLKTLSRALPSGGAMYPLEYYVLARRVAGLESGLYHFNPLYRAFSQLQKHESPFELNKILSQHELFGNPAVVVFVSAIFERTRIKYGPRALRYIMLEAGGVAVQMNLLANAMGLQFSLDGGGFEDRIEQFLAIDGYREALVTQFMLGHAE